MHAREAVLATSVALCVCTMPVRPVMQAMQCCGDELPPQPADVYVTWTSMRPALRHDEIASSVSSEAETLQCGRVHGCTMRRMHLCCLLMCVERASCVRIKWPCNGRLGMFVLVQVNSGASKVMSLPSLDCTYS